MMSENRLLNSSSGVLVEEQVIDVTNDAVVKIIENVEVNLIQEEIIKLKEERSEIKEMDDFKAAFAIFSTFFGAFILPFVIAVLIKPTVNDIHISLALTAVFLPMILLMSLSMGFVKKLADSQGDKAQKDALINSKRKDLFEKSLKVNLVNKDETTIDEKWREVIAFDENDDYVKFLTRIVENTENGSETIEAKRLKS